MNDVLFDEYTQIRERIDACNAFIQEIDSQIKEHSEQIKHQIEALKEQLAELSPFVERAQSALLGANISLPSVPDNTIATTASLNSLLFRSSKGDFDATQKLYRLAKAKEHSLRFEIQDQENQLQTYTTTLYKERHSRCLDLQNYLDCFAKIVLAKNASFDDLSPDSLLSVPTTNKDYCILGLQEKYYPLPSSTSSQLDKLYDAGRDCISLPVCAELPFFLRIDYTAESSQNTYHYLSHYLYNILRNYTPMDGRVVFLCPGSYDPSSLHGNLSSLCGKQNFIHFPTNSNEIKEELNFLANCDHSEPRFLFLHNYPYAYSGMDLFESLRLLIANSKRNNLCVIMTHLSQKYENWEPNDVEAMEAADVLVINSTVHGNKYNGAPFLFYTITGELAEGTLAPFVERNAPKTVSTHYLDNHPLPDVSNEVSFRRVTQKERGNLRIPIGTIGDKKQEYALDLCGENSFGYLMGATGSGKSTLLHLILLGVITQYHPDDVELWLADFGKATFNRYIHHCPPHVRYIILEAGDVQKPSVYAVDFINQMHKELKRREAFCAKTCWDELKNVDIKRVMPSILVLVDEFSRLSATISDNDEAKIKLQEVITQGRKFGFHIICDSQSYGTSASKALTQEAKNNIGVRLVMRHTDIGDQTEALALNLQGEAQIKLKSTLRTLPKYHTVCREWTDNGSQWKLVSNYALNMDKDSADETAIFAWIDFLKKKMTAVSAPEQYPDSTKYPAENACYLDKNLISVDGVTVEHFSGLESYLKKNPLPSAFNKVRLIAGRPGSFSVVHPIELLSEQSTGQNILFFCRNDRLETREAILQSLEKCLPFSASGMKHERWDGKTVNIAYLKNRIEALYDSLDCGEQIDLLITITDIPNLIARLRPRIRPLVSKRMQAKTAGSLVDILNQLMEAESTGRSHSEIQSIINTYNAGVASSPANENAEEIRYEQLLGYLLYYGAEAKLHFVCTASDATSMNSVYTSLSFIPDEYKLKPFAHFLATQMVAEDVDGSDLPFKTQFKHLPEDLVLYSDGIQRCYYSPYLFD